MAEELGFECIEFNASDARSKSILQNTLGDMLGCHTLSFLSPEISGPPAKRVSILGFVFQQRIYIDINNNHILNVYFILIYFNFLYYISRL